MTPSIRRSVIALVKLGYYEMTSIVALSVLFWLVSLPLLSVGGAILALFDVLSSVYTGTGPTGERDRMSSYLQSVRRNVIRGLPLSGVILFVVFNTYWYFAIGLWGRATQFLLGGIFSVYVILIGIVSMLRLVNIERQTEVAPRQAIRLTATSWRQHTHFMILQSSVVGVIMGISVVFPAAVLCILPAGLTLFEVAAYEELTGTDPGTMLARYGVPE